MQKVILGVSIKWAGVNLDARQPAACMEKCMRRPSKVQVTMAVARCLLLCPPFLGLQLLAD